MEPKLPRLLEAGRVEVKLGINGTHVFEESGIDRLLDHLTQAKRLFRPEPEAGSPEHKAELYQDRKKNVTRVAKIVSPYLLEEADKADEQDQEEVTVSVSSVYSALNVMAFIESLEMYEKESRAEVERLLAENVTLQTLIPHTGDGSCEWCGFGPATTVTLCEECGGPKAEAVRLRKAWPIKGVRVEDDKVIVAVKGGNDTARWLCGELLVMIDVKHDEPQIKPV